MAAPWLRAGSVKGRSAPVRRYAATSPLIGRPYTARPVALHDRSARVGRGRRVRAELGASSDREHESGSDELANHDRLPTFPPARTARGAQTAENPAFAGLSHAPQGDSNSHDPNGPQGPQPCAGTARSVRTR